MRGEEGDRVEVWRRGGCGMRWGRGKEIVLGVGGRNYSGERGPGKEGSEVGAKEVKGGRGARTGGVGGEAERWWGEWT